MEKKIGGLRELALFAGGGGGILGGRLLGWRTVCAVEFAPYARSVLLARQRDGHLDPFPIWDDVRTFDGRPWRGSVDVVSGGFPCQDISAAGKGAGIEGARSGLWGEMARIIGEVRPRFALVENSPMLTSRGLGVVLGDLAAMGYDARWGVLGARHVGAPHKRDRIWIVARDANGHGKPTESVYDEASRVPDVADAHRRRCDRKKAGQVELKRRAQAISAGSVPNTNSKRRRAEQVTRTKREDQTELGDDGAAEYVASLPLELKPEAPSPQWWETEPRLGRVANGVAHRVDRLRALGNGQVPAVVELAWRLLGGGQ